MIVLSLFDGMACGYEALKRAGIKVDRYYASEIDKYAIKIAKKNHPNIIQLGDINKFIIDHGAWDSLDGSQLLDIDQPDLIIGGSPCQGFSFAGKQLAFDDPRSRLFWKFVEVVNYYKPKYFLLENVRMKKEYLDIISEQLGVEPICINSSLVSAQNRVRYYWTNIPNVTQPEDRGIVLKDIIQKGVVDRDKSYCIDANYWKGGNLKSYFEKHRRQLVFKAGIRFKDYRKLTPIECERLQTLPDEYTEGVSNTQRYKMLGNGWTVDVIAHIFTNLTD
jgi:site-specific DNA-cytosine methylase